MKFEQIPPLSSTPSFPASFLFTTGARIFAKRKFCVLAGPQSKATLIKMSNRKIWAKRMPSGAQSQRQAVSPAGNKKAGQDQISRPAFPARLIFQCLPQKDLRAPLFPRMGHGTRQRLCLEWYYLPSAAGRFLIPSSSCGIQRRCAFECTAASPALSPASSPDLLGNKRMGEHLAHIFAQQAQQFILAGRQVEFLPIQKRTACRIVYFQFAVCKDCLVFTLPTCRAASRRCVIRSRASSSSTEKGFVK